jgi:hypothetical protein
VRNKVAQFLEWLAWILRVPDGLEANELVMGGENGEEIIRDGAVTVTYTPYRESDGKLWLELHEGGDRYLRISARSLRHALRQRVDR